MASLIFLLSASILVVTSSAAPQSIKPAITIPEGCKGKGFCAIRPDGYDEIENKLNELLPPYMIGMNSRSGGGPIEQPTEDDDNCPAVVTSESVYAYEHPTGTAVDIIVQTKLFRQTFIQVKCKYSYTENNLGDDRQCFRNLGLSDLHFKSECQESTATRTLLVYDPDVNIIKPKTYPISVCCSCKISKT